LLFAVIYSVFVVFLLFWALTSSERHFGLSGKAVGILDCLVRQSAFWIAPFPEQSFKLVWQDSLHLHKILSQMDLCIAHCQK